MMKYFLSAISGIAVLLLLANANAATINDQSRWNGMDKAKKAFANPTSPDQKVKLPTVNVKDSPIKGRAVPTRELPTTATPSQREVKTVESKNVDLKQRELSVRDTTVRSTAKTNFTSRRADRSFSAVRPESSQVNAANPAPINQRRIVVRTPEGLEELKKQLNRLP